jgi:hypothetical protein
MNDKEYAEKVIAKFTRDELLAFVFTYPEYLTDSYYKTLGDAMRKQYVKLTKKL